MKKIQNLKQAILHIAITLDGDKKYTFPGIFDFTDAYKTILSISDNEMEQEIIIEEMVDGVIEFLRNSNVFDEDVIDGIYFSEEFMQSMREYNDTSTEEVFLSSKANEVKIITEKIENQKKFLEEMNKSPEFLDKIFNLYAEYVLED